MLIRRLFTERQDIILRLTNLPFSRIIIKYDYFISRRIENHLQRDNRVIYRMKELSNNRIAILERDSSNNYFIQIYNSLTWKIILIIPLLIPDVLMMSIMSDDKIVIANNKRMIVLDSNYGKVLYSLEVSNSGKIYELLPDKILFTGEYSEPVMIWTFGKDLLKISDSYISFFKSGNSFLKLPDQKFILLLNDPGPVIYDFNGNFIESLPIPDIIQTSSENYYDDIISLPNGHIIYSIRLNSTDDIYLVQVNITTKVITKIIHPPSERFSSMYPISNNEIFYLTVNPIFKEYRITSFKSALNILDLNYTDNISINLSTSSTIHTDIIGYLPDNRVIIYEKLGGTSSKIFHIVDMESFSKISFPIELLRNVIKGAFPLIILRDGRILYLSADNIISMIE